MSLDQINLMYLVLDFQHSGKDFRSIRLRRNGFELFDFENVEFGTSKARNFHIYAMLSTFRPKPQGFKMFMLKMKHYVNYARSDNGSISRDFS